MSALLPKADVVQRDGDVRFVPKADILRCGKKRRPSITSSARASIDCGIVRPSEGTATKFEHVTARQAIVTSAGDDPPARVACSARASC